MGPNVCLLMKRQVTVAKIFHYLHAAPTSARMDEKQIARSAATDEKSRIQPTPFAAVLLTLVVGEVRHESEIHSRLKVSERRNECTKHCNKIVMAPIKAPHPQRVLLMNA